MLLPIDTRSLVYEPNICHDCLRVVFVFDIPPCCFFVFFLLIQYIIFARFLSPFPSLER